MKLTTFLAATLATAAAVISAAQAGSVAFNTPVTYSEPVVNLAPVKNAAQAMSEAEAQAAANPVMLERVIVTPSRTYAEGEWHTHLASKKASAQLYPVRSERRIETRTNNAFRIFLPLQ